MRVLLTHHFPLSQPETGPLVQRWATALESAGHEVRLLVVDDQHRFGETLTIERVVCGSDPNADLTFPLPRFSTPMDEQGGMAFSALSDVQLAKYRERLRRRLDAQILRFDPHLIHTQHVWLLGQLALETGVPYVMSAWGPELVDSQTDARFGTLAEQAAENAGRILAVDEATKQRVDSLFPAAAERTLLMPEALRLSGPSDSDDARATAAGALAKLYRTVLDERFG
jgi:Glycosyl transferase 4-like domain